MDRCGRVRSKIDRRKWHIHLTPKGQSLKTKLLPLGDDLSFLCGHGPGSTIGAEKLLSDKARSIFSAAYPGKSIDIMWWRPIEPTWFADLRTQYAEKFKAA